MTIVIPIIALFALIPLNYCLYSLACYLDNRFNLNVGEDSDDWPMVVILMFGFWYSLGISFAILFRISVLINDKVTNALALHKRLKEAGKKQREQATDVTYQLEKHLLGKK